ncbi:hypothetical protein OHD60_23900 [Escherichia coli]|nr:hypothetical protein [Escherichia coli]
MGRPPSDALETCNADKRAIAELDKRIAELDTPDGSNTMTSKNFALITAMTQAELD